MSVSGTVNKRIQHIIQKICLFDDIMFSIMFGGDLERTQLLLRIVMGKPDLVVISCQAQTDIRNLYGRSVRLDILARDNEGRIYNIEAQRASSGASPKRGRYHGSIIDANYLLKGSKWADLPETYIIFLNEGDYYKAGKPIYHIERKIEELDNQLYNDESHILYVNGAYRGDDDLGRLMHDFSCSDPVDMNYELLQEKFRYYKEDAKGVNEMSELMEELVSGLKEELIMDAKEEIAVEMIKENEPTEKIAQFCKLPVKRIKELQDMYRLQPV